MEYYKRPEAGDPYMYYAVGGTAVHIFKKAPLESTRWCYNYQVLNPSAINMILEGTTGAVEADLQGPINNIQTTLTGL